MAVSSKRKYFEGRGTRKRSRARVRIYEGKETSVVNGVPFEDFYADKKEDMEIAMRPIVITGLADKVFFSAKVYGGGKTGLTGAIVLGLARAIVKYDESLREVLSKENLLSRDMREKERKKYFLLKARKKAQFSKR